MDTFGYAWSHCGVFYFRRESCFICLQRSLHRVDEVLTDVINLVGAVLRRWGRQHGDFGSTDLKRKVFRNEVVFFVCLFVEVLALHVSLPRKELKQFVIKLLFILYNEQKKL